MRIVSYLSNRILNSGYTQRDIAAGSGICTSTIRRVIDQQYQPQNKTIVALLVFFDTAPPPKPTAPGRKMRGPKSLQPQP